MTKCLMLLPTNYNDGQSVEPAKLQSCLGRLDSLIGGHTVDGTCEGVYRMADGTYAHDTNLKVWACVEEKDIPALRQLAGVFAVELGQESIYLERTATTVEFVSGNRSGKAA